MNLLPLLAAAVEPLPQDAVAGIADLSQPAPVGGELDMLDLILHASIAFFWLFATVKVLEARKWS